MVPKVIPMISFLCAFIVIVVVWTLLFFNTDKTIFRIISLLLSCLGLKSPDSFKRLQSCVSIVINVVNLVKFLQFHFLKEVMFIHDNKLLALKGWLT